MSEVARLELDIRSPRYDEKLPLVDFNFMELRLALKKELERYKGLMYTEETLKVAKEDRAKLNKLKERIEDERKRIKKQYLEPYNAFETQIKELVAMIEEPVKEIDAQIKAFEEKKKEEKKALLQEFFDEGIGDLKGLVSFKQILDQRWLNATFSTQNAVVEIDKRIQGIRKDLETIELLKSEHETDLKAIYFRTLDLGEALKEHEALKQQKAAIEEREKAIKAQQGVSEPEAQQPAHKAPLVNEDGERLYVIRFEVVATKQQFNLLKQFFIENKIKYGRIE